MLKTEARNFLTKPETDSGSWSLLSLSKIVNTKL